MSVYEVRPEQEDNAFNPSIVWPAWSSDIERSQHYVMIHPGLFRQGEFKSEKVIQVTLNVAGAPQ